MFFLSVTMGVPFHEVMQWSSAEIAAYQCYFRLEPWGDERADIRTANQTKFIAEVSGAKRVGGTPFTIDDFMPFKRKKEPAADRLKTSEPPGLRNVFLKAVGKK